MKLIKQCFILLFTLYVTNGIAQENDIKNTIDQFFQGFHGRDTIKIKALCHPSIQMQSIANDKLTVGDVKGFLKSIASIPSKIEFEERLLSCKIQYDTKMANVWTPYEFYIDKKLSHKGVNSFTLLFDDNQWKIVHIIDTRIK